MRSKDELKQAVCEAIDLERDRIFMLGDSIAADPELGYKEFNTAAKFIEFLEWLGLSYRSGIARTGVISKSKGRKSILNVALMAELDAIIVPGHPDANPLTGAVHACGHNCMMAALAGVAIAMKNSGALRELDGDITLMAVPAEEFIEIEFRKALRQSGEIWFFGGKQEFIKLGELDDVDMMIMQHSSSSDSQYRAGAAAPSNGFIAKLVRYVGKKAHAGASPHEGINALNAALIGITAINAQRETFRDDDHIRVHPIITRGGDLVNIVPADVRLETYVRGSSVDAIMDASKKVDRALLAGGDAVGARTEITDVTGYLPALLNENLINLMYDNLKVLLGGRNAATRICSGLGGGSSDQGDVSQIMPSLQAFFNCISGGLHTEEYVITDKELAYITPAKALSMLLIDILYDGARTGLEIKESFKPSMSISEYLSNWGSLG
ncbi:MAG: amidohydrolase [Oscillospiraceae bacterium]|nr:amidohydrolase [Oscillospiraceae bacterium]